MSLAGRFVSAGKRPQIKSSRHLSSSPVGQFHNLLVSRAGIRSDVSLITLNRPRALNALNSELFVELNEALTQMDGDSSVGAIVLTGSKKAFAAGADIKEMKDKTYEEVYQRTMLGTWTQVYNIRKPLVAAVSGYALGGGCELAMMCDIILASPTAVFGQPEINLGVIPGAGGTQRLTRAVGLSRAMEIILTGRNFTGQEAAQWGLISRVVGDGEDEVIQEAIKVAETIASKGRVAVQAGKEATKAAHELSLAEGLKLERALFYALFATEDQKEGMSAFAEKRKPQWQWQGSASNL